MRQHLTSYRVIRESLRRKYFCSINAIVIIVKHQILFWTSILFKEIVAKRSYGLLLFSECVKPQYLKLNHLPQYWK